MTSTAQVNLLGNLYDVDPSLVGVRVELVFDPSDLARIDVRVHSRSYGQATPSRVRRHVHPKAELTATDEPSAPPVPTGIDYLRLIEARHTHSLNTRLNYAHLADPAATASDASPEANPPRAAGSTTDNPADNEHHDEHWCYETDLVALATLTDPADADPDAAPDPALDAELAGFAALLAHHHDTDHAEQSDEQSDDGQPQVAP